MAKVLVIGSGGREHALGWKIAQSEEVEEVLYAPGNPGMLEGKCKVVPVDGSKIENADAISNLIEQENIDLTVVGPEAPLAAGLVNTLNNRGHNRVFGPTKQASLLESDKFYSYDIMKEIGIPQANSMKCFSTQDAVNAIKIMSETEGVVIKARGLTGGKGVTVCDSKEEALTEISNHAENYGSHVLIAERLFGQEFSVFGISDGEQVSPLEISIQDHKPLLDGDKGPNTGGMGAYGPAPVASAEVVKKVADDIMTPVVQEMKKKGTPYKGFLYGGMIMTEKGPKVIEFNIRFGDPECQPGMMMVESDMYKALSYAVDGKLNEVDFKFKPGAACCVVLASQGYPGSYEKGLLIKGIEEAEQISAVKVFHAGTREVENGDGRFVTAGGRVLGVTGYSPAGISEAQKVAYNAVSKISIPGGWAYRQDIADKALK